jgi:hypothetical protein
VELLANSIAEMRTYGEGFIIPDQSPGLLDMSVIRNTNTKIILRLPDQGDRELVGRAAALNDEQIGELAKLERGVAAVYQNDWIEPVLTMINRCPLDEKPYEYRYGEETLREDASLKRDLLYFLIQGRVNERLDFDVERLERGLRRLNLSARNRIIVDDLLAEYKRRGGLNIWDPENFEKLSKLVSEVIEIGAAVENETLKAYDNNDLTARLANIAHSFIPSASPNVLLTLSHCMMKNFGSGQRDSAREKIYKSWAEEERGNAI